MIPRSVCIMLFFAAPSLAQAGGLCEMEGWQCAAISASVDQRRVSSIHDATHMDERSVDGGIADISVPVGKMLTLAWQGQPDKDVKQKARAHVKVISNRPAPAGCPEPDWMQETLNGDSDIDFESCQVGRNFVVTYKIEQGKKGESKVARVRVHVLPKGTTVDADADQSSLATTQGAPQLTPADQEAFDKLQVY